jgi:hypothetical protein
MLNLNHSVHNQVFTIKLPFTKFAKFKKNNFSIFALQQAILFHLTNLTPRITKACTKRSNGSSKSNTEKEVSSFRKDVLDLLKKDFKSSIENGSSFNNTFQLVNFCPIVSISTSNKWNIDTSFVSANSFELNKSSSVCNNNSTSPQYFSKIQGGLRKVNYFDINFHQRRTFKTHRALIADQKKSIFSRWKEAAFNQQEYESKHDSSEGSARKDAASPIKTIEHESLSKLLKKQSASFSPEQKKELKVSFAEGYMAASQTEKAQKDGRTLRYLRVLHLTLWICVGISIIFSVFSTSNGGSVFR